ncbi:MAG TPA: magnesium/cobalt transporter CorA [Acidobacteriota bacterium]|nr:magnesium/cobalt transporter CorA [Acidobacteriota bacterium]
MQARFVVAASLGPGPAAVSEERGILRRMVIRLKRSRAKRPVGAAPGTLVHIGERKLERVRFRVIDFDLENLEEKELRSVEECFPYRDRTTVSWINIDGLHDVEVIGRLGEHLGLHSLVQESILDTDQRPTIEEYDDHLYVVAKMLNYQDGKLQIEQLSLIVGRGFVLTFQERVGDFFNGVRERLRGGRGRIRSRGPDYLAYALLDAVVDQYFVVAETLGERSEELANRLMREPLPEREEIFELKMEAAELRRAVWPMREVVESLKKEEHILIDEANHVFLTDLRDHAVMVMEQTESLRETTSGLIDLHLSSLSQKMNEVMKVLTIIATIFIPTTFVAGVYGMNFNYMPELQVWWAYPAVLLLMLLIALVMLLYFRRKRWL